MRARAFSWLLLVALVFGLGCNSDQLSKFKIGDDPADVAKKRVDFILKTLKDRDSEREQAAVCQWYKGDIYIQDRDEQERAVDGFDSWRREGEIYGGMDSYEIGEARPAKNNPETFYIDVEIDGAKRKLKVPKGEPISWAG